MALIVTNSKIKNSNIQLENVYVRIQYQAQYNGTTCLVFMNCFENKNNFNQKPNENILTNIPELIRIDLLDTQNQDLATIHEVTKAKLEELGFVVTIDLA